MKLRTFFSLAPALVLGSLCGPARAVAEAPADRPAQTAPAPVFPAQVEQVVVDVVVTDKKGGAVGGLTREDLIVTEDGVPQEITTFEAIEAAAVPAVAPEARPRITVNTDPLERRGRTFAIVFDDTHMTPFRANQAKAAVAAFLEKGTIEGDRVSIASTAGAAWWTARMPQGRAGLIDMVKRMDGRYIPDNSMDRMTDYEAMRIHVYRDPEVVARVLRRWETFGVPGLMSRQNSSNRFDSIGAGTVDDPLVTGKAADMYYQATTRMRATLEVLERVLNGLVMAKGRKSVILISEGFVYDTNLEDFRRVNQASRRANAAVYFLNSRGLEGMPSYMTAEFGPALPDQDVGFALAETIDAVAGAEEIAAESGGFTVRNTNDLTRGIERIAAETEAYYLVGYIPTNTARDGKYRKISVRLARGRGLQIRARKGYYAPSDSARPASEARRGVDPVIQGALDSPWAQDDIPLRMTHFVGDEKGLDKAGVMVATDVDIRSLAFEEKDGRSLADLQFLLVVAHRESGEYFRYDQTINMKLLPATRQRLSWQWYPIVREFELKPGDYQAKIVVRDQRGQRVGSVMHEFSVPALAGFRASTPLLGDARQPGPNNTLGGPVVSARRQFAAGSNLFCAIEIYGATPEAKEGMPRVSQGYDVIRPDGVTLTGMPLTPIKPTSLGHLSRLFGFKLADGPTGLYQIVMKIHDEVSNATIELREPFEVVSTPAAAATPAEAAAPGSGQ